MRPDAPTDPSTREFKFVGEGGESFVEFCMTAVAGVTGEPLRREEVVVRLSRTGKYQSVVLVVCVTSGAQVQGIYKAVRADTRLRYLL